MYTRVVAEGFQIIRPAKLRAMLGVSHATLWRMQKRGELPSPLRISAGAVGWRESTIAAWLDEREREANGDAGS